MADGVKTTPGPRLERPLRVLLCPDQPDWAFHNIARNVQRYAPDGFDISIHFMGKPGERDLTTLFETMLLGDIDVVHIFWREDLFELLRPQTLIHIAWKLNTPVEEIVKMIGTRALTTSVYDHLHTSDEAMTARAASYHMIDGYTVSSKKLFDLYNRQRQIPSPDAVTPDGVDLDTFTPTTAPMTPGPLRVGWVGNSNWGHSHGGDPKGYHRLFRPAIDILKAEGLAIDVQLADPQVRRIPFEEMPDFYRGIDVLACTSAMEGTPNPVLEAMASGAAVVSTDVGIVPDAFGPKQSQFILSAPQPNALAAALRRLAQDGNELAALKRENRQSIATWSWQQKVETWWPFWLEAKRRANDPRLAVRRHEALVQSCAAYFGYVESRPGIQKRLRKIVGRFTGKSDQGVG